MENRCKRSTARELEMKVGEWPGRQSWLRSLTPCALLVGLLAFAAPAGAAQIDLTNCQPKQVRICAFDKGVGGWMDSGHHIYSNVGETHHFTCKANCKFWITEQCKDGECLECGSGGVGGTWLDHSWGKGTYQLISLEKTHSKTKTNTYKSADLKEVDPGTPCP